ncbi:mechanosensitive ion channel family protein [Desulfofustis glycolicus]|uniref:Small conductance mechanosensitive channel n=1 Tax=Desulfofustis glycolicus DSM 9705 TaxID=1121409 RepID=A0A1M5X4R7_9BACT|nr:mechanosensitive ion channel domain-containing protein [Desulfofustis glycolicus]SHH94787.1 small conductance mechanosensitive channel [Desulfofustis glycolicus DSM 9705]
MDWTTMLDTIYELLAVYGIKVVGAIAIFIVGRWVAKGVTGLIKRLMVKKQVDVTLVSFVSSLTYLALLAFVIIAALNQLGIQTASVIAVLAAAGLAIGLALQGSLSNFAAGILMIIFKPFKVGDYIEGAGVAGTVEAIEIFTTQLVSPANQVIIVPNAKIAGDNIVNYTSKGTRRLDLVFGIGYGDDIDTARQTIMELVKQDSRIFSDPQPQVLVTQLADSSVNLTLRAWAANADFWNVHFELIETVKKAFDSKGVSIPFPQRDVHLYEHKA